MFRRLFPSSTAPDAHVDALRRLRRKAVAVPLASVAAASLAAATVPVVAQVPLVPPLGLVVLLAWRLLRPDLWPAWIGLPLGLVDDLLSGRPLGAAVALWTLALLFVEASEDRMTWRGRWEEWLLAAACLGAATIGFWAVARATGGGAVPAWVTLPPLAAAILLLPLAQRLVARLDRWRLRP